jgi:hypothetical protein
MPTPPSEANGNELVRFVLKSGVALEMQASSLSEIEDVWAGMMIRAVCGKKADNTRVAFPMDNLDYMEEITCS